MSSYFLLVLNGCMFWELSSQLKTPRTHRIPGPGIVTKSPPKKKQPSGSQIGNYRAISSYKIP